MSKTKYTPVSELPAPTPETQSHRVTYDAPRPASRVVDGVEVFDVPEVEPSKTPNDEATDAGE